MDENTTLRILIVEDNAIITFDLTLILEKLGYQIAGTAESYEEAVKVLEQKKVDLVLIDIQLRGTETGIDLAKYIRVKHDIPIIFLTSNSDKSTVEEAKKLSPNGYIVKPFQEQGLYAGIETAVSNFQKSHEEGGELKLTDSIFVKDKANFYKVKINEIKYAKSFRNYVEIYTDRASYLYRITLSELLKVLPRNEFFKIHKSYIINLTHIESFNAHEVTVNKQILPLSPTYKDSLFTLVKGD